MPDWEGIILGMLIFVFAIGIYLSLPELLDLTYILVIQAGFFGVALLGLAIAIVAGVSDENA